MAINQILLFGGAAGANVLTPAEYAALAARTAGFQSGVAKSKEVNTPLRQAAFVAAMIGQFIANKAFIDVLDDGDVPGLVADFSSAITAQVQTSVATVEQAQALSDNTVLMTPSNLVSAMGILRGSWAFIASGTFVVPAGVSVLYITACGGGGGGGAYNGSTSGAGGGGGGGSCFKLRLNVTPGDVIPVTVGQGGGGAQTANGTGASGGSTSFGTHVTLNGGAGGISAGQGGVGGGVSGTTGQLGMPGQRGEQYNPLSLSQPQGGCGGASLFGAGGYGGGQGSGNLNGQPAFGFGAGGGGGAQGSGASGTNGFLVVEW